MPTKLQHSTCKFFNFARDNILMFDAPEDLSEYVKTIPDAIRHYSDRQNARTAWSGETGPDAEKYLQFGSTKYLDKAEALIDKMREEGIFSHGQKIYETSVVGSFPCVPHAIMGLPDTMYQLSETDLVSTTTPLRIYVELAASAYVTHEQLLNRGVAVLGLVLALQQVRPIELYVTSFGDPNYKNQCHGGVVRIQTAPLDLDRAVFMLANPGFYRQIMFGLKAHLAGLTRASSALPFMFGQSPGSDQNIATQRELLGMAPDDLFIPGVYKSNTAYINDPIGWIKKHLDAYKIA